jgi:hypothetical protein
MEVYGQIHRERLPQTRQKQFDTVLNNERRMASGDVARYRRARDGAQTTNMAALRTISHAFKVVVIQTTNQPTNQKANQERSFAQAQDVIPC